jgi:hypothetical protein
MKTTTRHSQTKPILLSLLLLLYPSILSIADNHTLHVGPGAKYETPCQAFAAAQDGDRIEIDAAGHYDGDVCRISANKLVIRGINGRPRINASGEIAEGKAIWVVGGNDTVIENIELSGCRGPNKNGASIRQEGTNLTVRSCYFHDNENGILCGKNPASEILVENTEFARNGYGDGYSHNIYIGNIKKYTMRFCYSHRALGGHLVKSRAAENQILYNRLTGEEGSSYELDLPNGGLAYVIGNIFQQSPTTTNSAIFSFGAEGPIPSSRLIVVNNTFVNDRDTGLFVQVQLAVTKRSMIVNNIFAGPGQVCSQGTALMLANFVGTDPGFLDRAGFDYRLKAGSPCIDAGADLEDLGMEAVIPRFEYSHSCGSKPRAITGAIDIGAYEKEPLY